MTTDRDNQFPLVVEGEIGGATVQTVNARDLHAFLEVRDDFSTWIKYQIDRARLLEDRDFVTFQENSGKGRPRTEFALTIEAAKHIGMMSGTERGYEVREYFLECERRAQRAVPQIDVRDIGQLSKIALQLIDVNRELEQRARIAEEKVEEVRPKSEFFDKFANADGLYTLQNTGRIVTGRPNKFIQELKRDHLFYQGGNLVPRVRYRQMGIFEVKVHMDEEGKARPQTFVTPKGLQYFAEKMGQH